MHKWETAMDEKTKIMREKGRKEEAATRFLSLQGDFKKKKEVRDEWR